MPTGIGYQTITAVGEESTVGTALNATQRLRNLEFTADAEYTHLLDESLAGMVAQTTPELGMKDIRGSWRVYNTYTLSNLLLKHFFGQLSSGRYTLVDSLEGKALTWAIDKQVSVWELRGVKINQLVLAFDLDGCQLSGTLIAQDLVYSGAENTATELAALLPNVDDRCKTAPDLNVRLGVASAALGTPEQIQVLGGTLTLTRPMAEQHINGQRGILEPVPENFLDATVSLQLARYTTNQYQTWKAANTRLALRFFFDQENGAKSQEWIIPSLVLTTAPNPVSEAGFIPQTLEGMIRIGQDTYTASTISADTTDDSFNDSANGFPMIYPGATLITSGFTNAANNAKHTVVSRTASKIIVTTNLVTETAGSRTLLSQNPLVQINEL